MNIFEDRPFNIRYVVRQHSGSYVPELLRTHRTAAASWFYIHRQFGIDEFGPTQDWSKRDDLAAYGRCAPRRAVNPALDGLALWQQADRHASAMRPDEPTCIHAVGSLPPHEGLCEWRNLIIGFAEDHLVSRGMVTDWAIHHLPGGDEQKAIAPHVHLLITSRVFDPRSQDTGRIRQTWVRTDKVRKSLAEKWWERTGLYPRSYTMAA